VVDAGGSGCVRARFGGNLRGLRAEEFPLTVFRGRRSSWCAQFLKDEFADALAEPEQAGFDGSFGQAGVGREFLHGGTMQIFAFDNLAILWVQSREAFFEKFSKR